MDADKDVKLVTFMDTLGEDTDVDFAKQMLEAHDWNVEAALNTVVANGANQPNGAGGRGGAEPHFEPQDYDEDGYRAPMRTGYTDQLLGPDPEAMLEHAAAQAARAERRARREQQRRENGGGDSRPERPSGRERERERDRERELRLAMHQSASEYHRLADHQEQGAIADAVQASYQQMMAEEQRRLTAGHEAEREEQQALARAIEASYKEQTSNDMEFRNQLEAATRASQIDATSLGGRSARSRVDIEFQKDLEAATRASQQEIVGSRPSSGRPSSGNASLPPNGSASSRRSLESVVGGGAHRPAKPVAVSAAANSAGRPRSNGSVGVGAAKQIDGVGSRFGGIPSSESSRSAAAAAVPSRVGVGVRRSVPMAGGNVASGGVTGATGGATSSASGRAPQRSGAREAYPPSSNAASATTTQSSVGAAARRIPVGGADRVARTPEAVLRSGVVTASAQQARPPGQLPSTSPSLPHGGITSATGSRNTGTSPSLRVASENAVLDSAGTGSGRHATSRAREASSGLKPISPPAASGSGGGIACPEPAAFAAAGRGAAAPGQCAAAREAAEADHRRRREEEAEQQRRRRRDDEAAQEAQRQQELADAEAAERRRRRREKEEAAAAAAAADAEAKRKEAEAAATAAAAEHEAREAERRKRAAMEAAAEQRRQAQANEDEKNRREAEMQEWKRREEEELRREEADQKRREAEKAAEAEARDVDEVVPALVALRKKYKDEDPQGLATCLSTLRAYIGNLAKNPQDQKFQRINRDNGAFRTRVAPFDGAIEVLKACGFEEEDTSLVVGQAFLKSKGPRLFDALAKVDVLLSQVKGSS